MKKRIWVESLDLEVFKNTINSRYEFLKGANDTDYVAWALKIASGKEFDLQKKKNKFILTNEKFI